MKSRISRILVCLAAVISLSAISPAAGSADQFVTPSRVDFGTLPIGTSSAPMQIELRATCRLEMECSPDPFQVAIEFERNGGDFGEYVETNDCPAFMAGDSTEGEACTITIVFTPAFPGERGAVLHTGEHIPIPPEPPSPVAPGPTATLVGRAPTFPAPVPSDVTPGLAPASPFGPSYPDLTTKKKKKKCKGKKKRRAAGSKKAKRCKKRKKRN